MINIIKSILEFRIVRWYNELEETNEGVAHDDGQQYRILAENGGILYTVHEE